MIVFGRRIHDRFEKIQGLFSDISSRVQENLAGVRMIRAFVQECVEVAEDQGVLDQVDVDRLRHPRRTGRVIQRPALLALY